MTIQSVLVTSKVEFLQRHRPLFEAMSQQFTQLDYLPVVEPPVGHSWETTLHRKSQRLWQKLRRLPPTYIDPAKTARRFIQRSRHTEHQIRQQAVQPDHIFHVFGLSCPIWDRATTPYAIYLDYTMALAKRNWAEWAPFADQMSYHLWLKCERRCYQKAEHLFCMSQVVKTSLIEDYGIQADNITVVGSSGNFDRVYQGEKTFGLQQILFNGSEFLRKGGDRVLAAFQQVRSVFPRATLVIIGTRLEEPPEGVTSLGYVSSPDVLSNLFLASDLVVAPARCDPFPTFLLEAMNYGVPCIVSAQDGMPEIVDHGINGVVLPEATPDALAREMIALLSQPSRLQTLSLQARYKIQTQLNWTTIAQTIAQVMRSQR